MCLRHVVALVLTFVALAGCGGHRAAPARLNLVGMTAASNREAFALVSKFLAQEGFVSSGEDKHAHTFANKARKLRVVYTDSAPAPKDFAEIELYGKRRGGFTAEGRQFYNRFLSMLLQQYGSVLVIVNEPPSVAR